MEELFVPNEDYQVFRGDGKIKVYEKKNKKLHKDIADRLPTNNAFAVTKLLKQFPELSKTSSIKEELDKVAKILLPYSPLASQVIKVANVLEGGDF
jgi:hypothetical protein